MAAAEAALDLDTLDRCIARQDRSAIAENTALAYDLHVRSTPTFFVGRVAGGLVAEVSRFTGAASLPALEEAIEALLTAAQRPEELEQAGKGLSR
jgi:protein-disulfide isomerase